MAARATIRAGGVTAAVDRGPRSNNLYVDHENPAVLPSAKSMITKRQRCLLFVKIRAVGLRADSFLFPLSSSLFARPSSLVPPDSAVECAEFLRLGAGFVSALFFVAAVHGRTHPGQKAY